MKYEGKVVNVVSIVVIGIGAMGKKYALMLNEGKISNMSLVAVCCRSENNKNWAKENLGENVVIYGSTEELYDHSDDFDAVLIVTPHKEHPKLAIEAFHHGKHVFCDKPAGVTVSEAYAMKEAAKEAGTKYAMMFHNRTYPFYQELKKMLDQKELGDISRILLESTRNFRTQYYHKSSRWRNSFAGEGGGMLINQGQHTLDIWQWLFGMPEAVYAKIPFGKYNDFLVDDEATILMEYPGKLVATYIQTTGEAFRGEKLQIVGTKGKVLLEDNRMHYWKNDADSRMYAETSKVDSSDKINMEYKVIDFRAAKDPYKQMLQNFSNAILNGEPLIAPGEEGEKALMLSNAAYLSAWKRAEIRLPFSEKVYDECLKQMIDNEKKE